MSLPLFEGLEELEEVEVPMDAEVTALCVVGRATALVLEMPVSTEVMSCESVELLITEGMEDAEVGAVMLI